MGSEGKHALRKNKSEGKNALGRMGSDGVNTGGIGNAYMRARSRK